MNSPVVLGSSLSGYLMSQALSRAGIDHVLVGQDKEPQPIPRLGEALNDTASPELYRFYGRELPECFHNKSHICYFNGNFATMIHLANPRRTRKHLVRLSPLKGTPRYPWFGDGLFHLDRILFDRAIYHKVKNDPHCRFVDSKVTALDYDQGLDRIRAIHLADGQVLSDPLYVFDTIGYQSVVAQAASVGCRSLAAPQRVVFTHYQGESCEVPEERPWWCHGTNLLRLDREYDGFDGIAWLIPLGATLSVGLSVDQGSHGDALDSQELLIALQRACERRGIAYRSIYPKEVPLQELRHQYYVRDRAYGKNWLLVGGSFLSVWFTSSSGLWSVTAACGMAPLLLEKPELAAYYQKVMRGLIGFHNLLDGVIHGPLWRSSLQVYKFFSRGSMFIIGRIASYLRIKNQNYGILSPVSWFLGILGLFGRFLPSLTFLCLGGTVVVRSRLCPDRKQQGRHFVLYFFTIPFRLVNFFRTFLHLPWAVVPRQTQLPGPEGKVYPEVAQTP